MNSKSFGDKLRELRQKAGKSQEDVAEEIIDRYGKQIRMSQSTVSALEKRELAPREDILDVLCDYYDVPISFFFDNYQESPSVTDVRSYLDALRRFTPESAMRFAHTTEHRHENDEIDRKLQDMPENEDLDTDFYEDD